MRDTEFVAELLRLKSPWTAKEAKLDLEWQGPGLCPECGREAPKHDHRERSWRDLDLCGDKLYINARVPRIDCPRHGVRSVSVPWAQGRTAFTARFERMVILLLREMSITAVLQRMRISWDLIDGILQRAVDRGLEARQEQFPRFIGIDEKTFKKGHISLHICRKPLIKRGARPFVMEEKKPDRSREQHTTGYAIRRTCLVSDKREFEELRKQHALVGRAWAIKESFTHFWQYKRESVARRFFHDWSYWATHSRIPQMVEVAKMLKRHFANILTYVRLGITNAAAEGMNSKIQWIKYQAR